jgi:hypothetical protein
MNRSKNRANSLGKSVLKRKIAKIKKELAKEGTITDDMFDRILSMAMSYDAETFLTNSVDNKLLNTIIAWKRVQIEKQKLLVGTKDIDDSITDYPQD